MQKNSLVLLSGGLDSSFNLAVGSLQNEVALTLTLNYGQKSVKKEIESSKKLSDFYNVPNKVIDVLWLGEQANCALTSGIKTLPSPDLTNEKQIIDSAKSVWVPNRNGLFVNIAAVFAESLGLGKILVGFNKEEAHTFSDNSSDFIIALNNCLSFSTRTKVMVDSFCKDLTKLEIMKKSMELKLPLNLVWPCYEGGEEICKMCESCKRFLRAKDLVGCV